MFDESRGTAAPIDPNPARWEVIAARLRDEITGGTLQPGERLPNETELAGRFQVNRHTLRQAMQQLVRELVLDYALQRRTRMTTNLASVGEHARREILFERVAPVAEFARALGVQSRTSGEWLATRASVRGRVVSLSTAVFPLPRLRGMTDAVRRLGTITAALRSLGVSDYTRASSVISARLPSQAEADALARSTVQPILVVHYTNIDAAGVPVEAGATLFAADAVQLRVEPERDGA